MFRGNFFRSAFRKRRCRRRKRRWATVTERIPRSRLSSCPKPCRAFSLSPHMKIHTLARGMRRPCERQVGKAGALRAGWQCGPWLVGAGWVPPTDAWCMWRLPAVRWRWVGGTMVLVTGGSVPWMRSGKAHLTLNCTSQWWHTEDSRGHADLQIP
jgi:hypothetical protein